MLRASTADNETDLQVVVKGAEAADNAVPSGPELVRYAEAVIAGERELIRDAIQAILESLGGEALVDAAAICAQFNAITRVADATGVQLDTALERSSAAIRDQLGIDAFNTTVE